MTRLYVRYQVVKYIVQEISIAHRTEYKSVRIKRLEVYVPIMYSHGFLSLILSHYLLYTVGNKDKLGDEDVGQPGILTDHTWVSHTSPKGKCGTPRYHR